MPLILHTSPLNSEKQILIEFLVVDRFILRANNDEVFLLEMAIHVGKRNSIVESGYLLNNLKYVDCGGLFQSIHLWFTCVHT